MSYTLTFTSKCQLSGDEYNSNWFFNFGEWIDQEYIVIPRFSSRSVNFSTVLGMPTIYTNMLSNSSTHTTKNSTIHAYSNNYAGTPINNVYATSSVTFNYIDDMPIYISGRPRNNHFYIKFVKSDSDDIFEVTSQQFYWTYELTFLPYKASIPKKLDDMTARPFNLILNSVNGVEINTKSHIQFNYDWNQHKSLNRYQKYNISFRFISKGMDLNGSDPVLIKSNMITTPNNYIVNYSSSAIVSNDHLGSASSPSFNTLSSLYCGTRHNVPITCVLPDNDIFYIKIMDFDITNPQLFVPSVGAMSDWMLILNFQPTF